VINSSIALLGNSFSICPVINSKPGALWLAHFLISSLTSDGEKGLIGRVVRQASPKDILTIFSKLLLLLFVCGVVNTLERYSAKAVAFSLSVFPSCNLPVGLEESELLVFFNYLVAFQIVWSSFDKVLIYVSNVVFRVS